MAIPTFFGRNNGVCFNSFVFSLLTQILSSRDRDLILLELFLLPFHRYLQLPIQGYHLVFLNLLHLALHFARLSFRSVPTIYSHHTPLLKI